MQGARKMQGVFGFDFRFLLDVVGSLWEDAHVHAALLCGDKGVQELVCFAFGVGGVGNVVNGEADFLFGVLDEFQDGRKIIFSGDVLHFGGDGKQEAREKQENKRYENTGFMGSQGFSNPATKGGQPFQISLPR